MLGRFFSGINQKLAKYVVSKTKFVTNNIVKTHRLVAPAIKRKLKVDTSDDAYNVAMNIGAVTGAAIGAVSAYQRHQSSTVNIFRSTAGGILGAGIGYVAPPIIVKATLMTLQNPVPLGLGLGMGVAHILKKREAEETPVNDRSAKKSFK